MSNPHHREHRDYPVDCYINYARSIGLAIERSVTDYPPKDSSEFWRICEREVKVARWRMRDVSGQIRKIGSK